MVVSVSTVIPCYRCTDTVRRAVESVAQQTLLPAEVILVDDGSTDNTLEVLFQLQRDYGRDWIEIIALEQNQGVSVARNTGWNAASQPYVAFLDADETWHPRKIELQYPVMKSHPDVALTGHSRQQIEADASFPTIPDNCSASSVTLYNLLLSNCFATSSVMLQRRLTQRFQPGKQHCEDFLLWLQIVLDGCTAWLLDCALAYCYKASFGEKGLSGDLWKMERGELDMYWQLCRDRSISPVACAGLTAWSLGKYLRRILIVIAKRKALWQ